MIGGINLTRAFEVESFSSGATKTWRGNCTPAPMVPPSLQWCDIKRNVLADQLARPQILLHENPLQQQEIFRRIFSSRLQIKIPSPPCLDCQCTLYVPTCTNIGFKLFLKERIVNLWFWQNSVYQCYQKHQLQMSCKIKGLKVPTLADDTQ